MAVLEIERRSSVRLVRLDSGKRNVLTLEAVEALKDAIAPDSEAPAVVLSGRDDAFCAGLDNASLAKGGAEREALLAAMGELLLAAVTGPTRIVVACEGHAVAAGAMLLLIADVRIGVPGSYKIGFTEPRLGMPLPALPALLARERLDRRRLHELAVLGRTLNPEDAVGAGFLDKLVAPFDLHAAALTAAKDIAELSDAAYQGSVASVWGTAIQRMGKLVEEQNGRR
jgi:enoyl-CoA hydratase